MLAWLAPRVASAVLLIALLRATLGPVVLSYIWWARDMRRAPPPV